MLLFCRKNLSIIICIYFHQIALPSLIIHFFFISPFTEDAGEKSEMCSSVSIPQYLSANHPTPLRNHFQKINILPVQFFENGLHPVMICQAQTISRQHQRLRCFLIQNSQYLLNSLSRIRNCTHVPPFYESSTIGATSDRKFFRNYKKSPLSL